ncbi:ribonuclease H family protein [Photobacterium sp. SDRW27]|uniref:ribonuclease H family protein n=1 Tax=Photobacterium obscurum TaxID=2829490 RepID=UPI002243B52A|nr:ribonuclease H family protein [Photobacterium obscurum]MCW8330264.1 ribonuclease H family protein [Photobacterium obscurum]
MAQKFYVVWVGRETGVFTSWDKTKQLVDKYPKARYKSFKTREEAEAAFKSGANSVKKSASSHSKSAGQKKASSKALPATKHDLSDFDVNIYCDGACDPNPGKAGSGVAVYCNNELAELWYGLYNPNGTNNTAELNALYQALLLAQASLEKGKTVQILSDSQYSINCISVWAFSWKKKGWMRKEQGDIKNLEVIQASHELYIKLKDKMTLSHVKGHAGIEGNELADRMSVYAVDQKDTGFHRYTDPLNIDEILSMRAG